jgi:hypothetical protein
VVDGRWREADPVAPLARSRFLLLVLACWRNLFWRQSRYQCGACGRALCAGARRGQAGRVAGLPLGWPRM